MVFVPEFTGKALDDHKSVIRNPDESLKTISIESPKEDTLHRCRSITVPISVRLLSGLLFAILTVPLGAQAASESGARQGFGPAYDAAQEITVVGTIQSVVAKPAAGSPAGMHLLVAGPQGVVDAHLGSFLSKETIAALQPGVPVQIVGATMSLQGKNYFLARQLTVGSRIVMVRSERGFLMHEHSSRMASSKQRTASEVKKNETAEKVSEL